MVMPSQTLTRIDWRKLSAIDVNTFESELQSNRWSISEIGPMIAYSFIDSEFDIHSFDSNFVKLFKLSQILIAYLLEKYYYQYEKLKDQVDHVKDIVEENRKLRQLIDVYQQAFTFGGTFRRSIDANNDKSSELFQCPDCPKAFGSSVYLRSHICRRHPENSILSKGLFPLTQRINQYHSALLPSTAAVDDVKKELITLKDQLKKAEEQLAEEKDSRIALQDRMGLEFEAKIKQLTSLLKRNKNDETVNQLINKRSQNSNQPNQKMADSFVQKITEIDQDNTFGDSDSKQSPSKSVISNLDEPQDLTGLLLVHTQEVRNLGNRLEKLVDKLWSNEPMVNNQESIPQKSSNSTSESDSFYNNDKKSKPKILINSQPIIIEEITSDNKKVASETKDNNNEYLDVDEDDDNDVNESDQQKDQGEQVLSYLDRYMEALGIQDKSNIGSSEFVEAMKVIKERRRRNGFQDKVNSLKDALDYEIRTHKIGQTLAQLNEDQQRISTSSSSAIAKDTTKSPWLIARNSLEETSSKHQQNEKHNRVRFGGITIKELDGNKKIEINREKAIKRLWTKPKSVLIRRDAQGNRIGHDTDREKLKRRISFSETRIEISPEYSSDDDDFDQMMSGEIQTAPVELSGVNKRERINSPLVENEINFDLQISSKLRQEEAEINQQQHDPIPPPTKPRHSKALTLDDHLSTADLKWFDSDGSEDELNHDNQKTQSRTKLTKNNNSNQKDNLESDKIKSIQLIDNDDIIHNNDNNQDDQRISVTELTKIIEEQLHNRSINTNLTNSVDVVTGKVKNSTNNNSYGVKATGTLNYDSDSD